MFQALIIGVTETSLSYRVIDGYIEIPGYTILRQARDLAYARKEARRRGYSIHETWNGD